MRPKPNSKGKAKFVSPLDAQKRALAEQQIKINLEIERRQKLIEDAPRIAEQAARRRREELLQRKSRTEARFGSPALNDPRFAFEAHVSTPLPRLRKHRNQGMFTFFILCLILAGVLFWLYTKIISGT